MPINLPSLLDITPVMAVFAILTGSAFSTSNVLQWLRNLFLDGLTARMSDTQRNELLRTILVVLNVGVILGLALFMHFTLSPQLLLAVFLGAFGSAGGAHFSYVHTQKPAPQAPEIDPSVYAQFPPSPPPTDSPESAALDLAA